MPFVQGLTPFSRDSSFKEACSLRSCCYMLNLMSDMLVLRIVKKISIIYGIVDCKCCYLACQ
jgi:hypothetical protein